MNKDLIIKLSKLSINELYIIIGMDLEGSIPMDINSYLRQISKIQHKDIEIYQPSQNPIRRYFINGKKWFDSKKTELQGIVCTNQIIQKSVIGEGDKIEFIAMSAELLSSIYEIGFVGKIATAVIITKLGIILFCKNYIKNKQL